MEKHNIKTPYSLALAALASEIYKKKTKKEFLDLSPSSPQYIYLQADGSEAGSCNRSLLTFHKEVSGGEFITALEALPDYESKDEPVSIPLKSSTAIIHKGEVSVGCQVYTEENVETVTAGVNRFLNSFHMVKLQGKKDIRVDRHGITCDGVNISFDEFKSVTAKYEELK